MNALWTMFFTIAVLRVDRTWDGVDAAAVWFITFGFTGLNMDVALLTGDALGDSALTDVARTSARAAAHLHIPNALAALAT